MNRKASLRRYGLALGAAVVAVLLLAALIMAGSAQSAGGRSGANDRQPALSVVKRRTTNDASLSVNLLRRRQSVDHPSVDSTPAGRPRARVEAALHSSPVMFIENVGQFDERARPQGRNSLAAMGPVGFPGRDLGPSSEPNTADYNGFVANPDSFSCDTVTEIPQAECEALVALYNSTNGANWDRNDGWMTTNTPCDWYGVGCSSAGHVWKLDLHDNQLSGSIPPELGNLVNLQALWLWGNQLSGSIPPELGNLTNLQGLYLDKNQLSGTIPPELGNLTGLHSLNLGNNQLSGTILPELGNLTNLVELSLGSNQLSGSIPPELGNLTNLQRLSLSWNQLSGSIPPELGNLTNLQWLYLNSNQLSGSIPPELGNLANLYALYLDSNQLSGSIPSELGNLTNLRTLNLRWNQLSGNIPPELGNLINLQGLWLYSNQLSGNIPPELGNLANLQWLDLPSNQLSGSIPPELGSLTNLQQLFLNDNLFSGVLPATLTSLNLSVFWFHNTNLCEPADAAFQAWLAGISDVRSTGVTCFALSISHIEVTQAIQCLNNPKCFGDPTTSEAAQQLYNTYCGADNPNCDNAVPLIAGKPTFVRVYVSCGPDGNLPESATVQLRGYGPSGELPSSPLAPLSGYLGSACHDNLQAQRSERRKTLNFALPPDWASGTVTLRAEVTGATPLEKTFKFLPGNKLRVYWVPMVYVPPQPPPPPGPTPTPVVVRPDQQVANKGITELLAMYPVAKGEVTYRFQPWFEEQIREPFTCSDDYCPADTGYLRALNRFWDRMNQVGKWVDGVRPDRLYGWVPREAQGNVCGIADAIWANRKRRKGRVAAGVDNCGGETLAHELGHILDDQGLRHTPNRSHQEDPNCISVPAGPAGDYPKYPGLPLGSIGEWGIKITGITKITKSALEPFELLDPARTYDFMSYCSPEWVSPFNYQKLNEGFEPAAALAIAQAPTTPERHILASGIVFSPALTITLSPLFVITSTIPPDPDLGGAYCLELRSGSEAVLDSRCFDLAFTNPETGEPTGAEGFSLVLPYPDGTQAVVLTHSSTELGRTAASPAVPQVQLLSPNGGEIWQATGTYTITWTASDSDGDRLYFAVSFSPDDGVSWNPLVLETAETQWVVDASRLPGTTNARIRVEVSDGFNAGVDVSDASFTVMPKGPQAFILSSPGDITITVGTPLFLQGYAYDLEDGILGDAALSWSSDRDGDLGKGAQVLAALSLGRHILTFTATDSDSNTATATVQAMVTFPEDVVPDCEVNVADVQAMADHWRQTVGLPYDFDGDERITVADIMRVAAAWGDMCP